jgi:N-acyl-D-aspartate/D-glutamate deacylase
MDHMNESLLLKNGMLFDGSGSPGQRGSVFIKNGAIEAVGIFEEPTESAVMNCEGLSIAPGFIDAHSHSDLQVLAGKREKLRQGVTAEVVGNCGFSPYPCGSHAPELREFANGILHGNETWSWPSARAYLSDLQTQASCVTPFSLVGHGSLRVAFAGNRQGPLPETTVDAMEHTLEEALADGAVGFSTGLMYAPGSSAPKEELERLCRVVARQGKIYTTHMRDYGFKLLEAIDEQVALARGSGCRLQISHLQAVGRANWHLNQLAIERVEAARSSGIDIAFDCYPYTAGSTVLSQLLPQAALDGGTEALLARLTDPAQRKRIAAETIAGMAHEWTDIFISAVRSEQNRDAVGKSIATLSEARQQAPIDVVFDLLIEENAGVNMLEFNQSEENLRAMLSHPLAIVISDGFYVSGRPHPRLFGTFAELLGSVCRDRGWMPETEAIRKVTGFAADRFGLKGRGYLRPGYMADITVFDSARVTSPATYENPEQSPQGIRAVIRSGQVQFSGPGPTT